MPGLLERAESISGRNREGSVSLKIARDGKDASGVTTEERDEMLLRIERLFTQRRPIDSAEGSTPRRAGVAFPILVNVIAFAVLAGAVVGVRYLGGNLGSQRASGPESYLTTEGLVVKEVKQQAAVQLSEREARIAEIKRDLATLRQTVTDSSGAAARMRQKELEQELSSLQSDANIRLSQLSIRREQDQFLVRQLQAIYQNIQNEISSNRLQPAIDAIDAANHLLQPGAADPSQEIASIAPAMLAGNEVLREALLFGQRAVEANTSSDLPQKLAEIDSLVRQGDQRYQDGDHEGAAALYVKAVTALKNIDHAYTRLKGISQERFDQKREAMASQIETLRRSVVAAQATVQRQHASLLDLTNRASRQEREITSQADRIRKQRLKIQEQTEELAAVVNSLQQSIAHSASKTGSGDSTGGTATEGSSTHSQVVDLLKTKVAIRTLADSPEARKRYPGLYAQLDAFFAEYGKTYANRGRRAALAEVASALKAIMASLDLNIPGAPILPISPETGLNDPSGNPIASEQRAVFSYLANLDAILESISGRTN